MGAKLYDYEERLGSSIERLKDSDVPERSKELILEFKDFILAQGLSKGRIVKYLVHTRKLAGWLEEPFDKADKKDIVKVVGKIERKDYSEWTKRDYKIALKKFYKWLNDGEYPDKVDFITTTFKRNHQKLPDEILSKEEIRELIEAAKNERDRAFVAALYESGCRIGEFGSLELKHVKFDEYGAKLIVNGKSGSRRVRLVSSTPYLSTYIEHHPKKGESEAPLWVTLGPPDEGEQMSYRQMNKRLKSIAEKAGVEKPVNPHNFRHSRATHLANHLTEAQMCEYFGWVQGSDQPATYVHLSGRDLDNKLLKLYGKKEKDDNGEEKMKPRVCPRCEHENGPTNKFCAKCGMPLEPKIAQEIGDKKEGVNKLMKKLLKDPEVKEMLLEKISEKELDLE